MSHDHQHVTRSTAGKHKGRLKIVVVLTLTYLIAEVVGGIYTHSLALIADAGHMLSDVAGLILALFAIHIAERPATPERTYGYYRTEILAAVINAVVLIGVSIFVLYEAYQRFRNPPEVSSIMMLGVASIGLVINIVGAYLLKEGSKESLNMKGAYFEVMSDLLTSVGVIIAAIIMWVTGWYYADPIISAGIGLFILPRTWILLRDAVGVLLEGTPSDINLAKMRETILNVPGVDQIHDLHVWALTSGVNAMTVHVLKKENASSDGLLGQIRSVIERDFHITHTTIQIEGVAIENENCHL